MSVQVRPQSEDEKPTEMALETMLALNQLWAYFKDHSEFKVHIYNERGQITSRELP